MIFYIFVVLVILFVLYYNAIEPYTVVGSTKYSDRKCVGYNKYIPDGTVILYPYYPGYPNYPYFRYRSLVRSD